MNRTRAALAALLVLLVVGGAGTRVATAHEGEGILTLETQQVAPDGTASYQVRLTWENDGHAAIDSTVTAAPIAPDGTPGVPVVMQAIDQDGRYAGTLTFPDSGTWTVRFTSITPAATSEVVEEITIIPATTTTAAPSEPTATSATATSEVEPADDEAAAAPTDSDADDGGSSAVVVITLVIVLSLLAAIVVGFARSNRRLRDGP